MEDKIYKKLINNEYINDIDLGYCLSLSEDILNDLINNGTIPNTYMNKLFNELSNYLYNNRSNLGDKIIINIIKIGNIIYNNTDLQFIDDGMYDLLYELYKKIDPNYQVGCTEIDMKTKLQNNELDNKDNKQIIMRRVPKEKKDKLFYPEVFLRGYEFKPWIYQRQIMRREKSNIGKINVETKHNYPKLVGTLDKSKFVMCSDADEKGVLNDSNVSVLERDFFGKHIQQGILDPHRNISILLEFKEDGVSIEGDVNTILWGARSRGDANEDLAADLTPKISGYRFPNVPRDMWNEPTFGMKFEAILRWNELNEFNRLTGYNYKNCRTGVIGLLSRKDAWKYRDLLTLIPLATSLDCFKNRVEEIEFLNKFYATREKLRYTVITGNLQQILYQIKRFANEAEYMRQFMGYMYDGIVISYLDQDIIDKLPRVNAVNKHTIALKFNPEKKSTIFRGWTYEVGQNGEITPMMHYDPIEFFGTIHTKSSGHSYNRFMELQLREGNVMDFEYVNDVMPYGTKPDNQINRDIDSKVPMIPFIKECPICHTKLVISKTGKNICCPNMNCDGRKIARMVNMLSKLNIKDIAEANIRKTSIYSFRELVTLSDERIFSISHTVGPAMTKKIMGLKNDLMTTKRYDYEIMGALGFNNIGKDKWKKILNKYNLLEVVDIIMKNQKSKLSEIPSIGPGTAETLCDQFEFFKDDIMYIITMDNIKMSKGMKKAIKVRITGFRNAKLVEDYLNVGFDIGEGSCTKDTDILLVPNYNHKSTKVNDALKKGVTLMTVDDFIGKYPLYTIKL